MSIVKEEQAYAAQMIELLKLEAAAIMRAAERCHPEQLEQAVGLLHACRGKVVLIGVGKSGLVARKIAATLTSTGTAAVFLHPADALHGDLGIVSNGDVAVALSNSGETDELLTILPYLKNRQVPVVAITGNLSSSLARHADVNLDASVDHEACPYNLTPTTSTTVALAIGDALAVTLMKAKGISQEDFASNHPSGRLGKRLTLRVRDLMHSGQDNPTVSPQASWLEVAGTISKGGLGAVNVVDEAGYLEGVITDGDLRRSFTKFKTLNPETVQAAAIMTRTPVSASPEMLAYDALRLMEDRASQISVLPVVNQEGFCVGLIRLHDIVRSGL
jgi:arabinose-5-phosphate isomerase